MLTFDPAVFPHLCFYLKLKESPSSSGNKRIHYCKQKWYSSVILVPKLSHMTHLNHHQVWYRTEPPPVRVWYRTHTHLSRTGNQGRLPFLPIPRSGHTATIPFRTRDMFCFLTAGSRQHAIRKHRKWRHLLLQGFSADWRYFTANPQKLLNNYLLNCYFII